MNLDKTYIDFIKGLKEKIALAKNRTILSVNRAMIELYFEIGKNIVQKQESLGWGKSVVDQMAKDLQSEFGKKSGYSMQNLWYMRQFYLTYQDNLNLQQLVGDLPWGQNILIFTKCKYKAEQEYYIKNTQAYGWSRNVLTHHIKTERYKRDTKELKQNNFTNTLPMELSEMADEMIKSEAWLWI